MHLRFNNVLRKTHNLLKPQTVKPTKSTSLTTSLINKKPNLTLEHQHFSTYTPYSQPLKQINEIISKSTKINQSLNPSDLDFITPDIIDTCIREADKTLMENKLQHYKNTATPENNNSIISLNPLSKHHHHDPFSGYLVDVATLDSLKEKLSKPIDSSSLNMSKRIEIIKKMLMLIPDHIESLMTAVMLGGPKPAEGAKYEILEAKWLIQRVLDGVKLINESQDLKFSNQLSQQHSIVAVPSNFFALGLPDFINLFFHGSDHIMIITPPQGIPFWQIIESVLIKADLPKSNITVTTVTNFPEDLVELTSMVNAARMVGNTTTYELMANSIATNTNSSLIYLGGEVSGNPNVNQGIEDAQHVFSVAIGNKGNTGELCSSSSDVVTTDRQPVNPMFAEDLQKIIDTKTHLSLATTYKPNEELAKNYKSPSVTISDQSAKEIWGPHIIISSHQVNKHINTNHALTHAITYYNAKIIVENLKLSLAGNKYVAFTSEGAGLQPMGTNPLAVVPPTSFGSPTSYAVRGDQPGQNTLQSALQFAHLDTATNMKQEALETILKHILTSTSASKPYSGYPMFNTKTENLDTEKFTTMQTFTLFESKPILIDISSTAQLKQLDSLLHSLNESPFKHKIMINFNNIEQSKLHDVILNLPKHDENSYFCLENIDIAKFAEKFDRPSLIISYSELPKITKQKLYTIGHSVSSSTNKLEIAMKITTQSSLCIGINPENRSLSEAEEKIAIPLLNVKLKSNIQATFTHPDQWPIK